MRFLTTEEAKSWCQERALSVSANQYLRYNHDSQHCFTVGLEIKPSRVIALADYLIPTWEDVPFQGALLWIREWGVWGDYAERAGAMIVKQMRLAKGERAPLEERPGHLFGPDEVFEMHSYLLIPLLFGWDAFVVPKSGDYFIFVSHDGVADVVTRTANGAEELRRRVHDWEPQVDKNWYPRISR